MREESKQQHARVQSNNDGHSSHAYASLSSRHDEQGGGVSPDGLFCNFIVSPTLTTPTTIPPKEVQASSPFNISSYDETTNLEVVEDISSTASVRSVKPSEVPRRRSSQAIPIHRKTRPESSASLALLLDHEASSPASVVVEDDGDDEWLLLWLEADKHGHYYEGATWRLYQRITQHREKYPLTESYFTRCTPDQETATLTTSINTPNIPATATSTMASSSSSNHWRLSPRGEQGGGGGEEISQHWRSPQCASMEEVFDLEL